MEIRWTYIFHQSGSYCSWTRQPPIRGDQCNWRSSTRGWPSVQNSCYSHSPSSYRVRPRYQFLLILSTGRTQIVFNRWEQSCATDWIQGSYFSLWWNWTSICSRASRCYPRCYNHQVEGHKILCFTLPYVLSWFVVILWRGVKVEPRKRYVLHTVQLTPQRSYAQGETEKYVTPHFLAHWGFVKWPST